MITITITRRVGHEAQFILTVPLFRFCCSAVLLIHGRQHIRTTVEHRILNR